MVKDLANKVTAYSGEDMKRRRSRSIALALLLAAFAIIVLVSTILKIKGVGH